MLAFKIFVCSLVARVAGGYGAFRLGVFLALKFVHGEHAELMATAIGMLAGAAVGICSAITAGVLAGRATRDRLS